MPYVIGIDLGTSSVKALLVNQAGRVVAEATRPYPLLQPRPGFSEQDPEQWVQQTISVLQELTTHSQVDPEEIEGLSFSGQMHGLVLLDQHFQVLRPAILWNDTRTTEECQEIRNKLGPRLLDITKNDALEGFTLPKLLWVKKHEPHLFEQARFFLLPKDYLRFRLTGEVHMELSDAAGTLLLDVIGQEWSQDVCAAFGLDRSFCPPLVQSHQCVGTLLPEIAGQTGLKTTTKVFAGGADNACGAVGAGILTPGVTLCSIGTSGVILSYEDQDRDFGGKIHFFNHAKPDAYYTMGVTLAAGYSLSWFRKTFAHQESFDTLLRGVEQVPPGSRGLVFTPYLVGERTPHADAVIRASFIGIDGSHTRQDFVRAVLEGVTFSLQESIQLFRQAGKRVHTVVSIGGGAKSDVWLQMQADVFDATVVKLNHDQGPAFGAAMLAAVGCGWFSSLDECSQQFVQYEAQFTPIPENVHKYEELFKIYQQVYAQTRALNQALLPFR
ncbi:xylulokinase [Caldalkalibacillus uzonensis]|uniref:Xylulose kinase n=1 Tax=Caldalkalibacillus uzonensis TaxID=353224 RepID=A0ABU0CQB6_9BACI|nr:xylulokinase [Caldalkalibacillus uzonensis]MDQ0338602.1 xylulokinase [Caldalkalibacillus uzonensis]